MQILVTGGTGFAGSHLVRRLLDRGHNVTALDNQPGLFAEELKRRGAAIIIGSVSDRELVHRTTAGHEVVYHLAASFRQINLPKNHYWRTNVEGTRFVLDAAEKHGIAKVVYCSTQGVHGHVENPPGGEDSPIAPEDYYQYTKYQGEVVCHEYMERGLDITIVRPTAIYGPGDPGRFLMLYRMVRKGRFLMFGNGLTTYHPVYIDNLVDLFELAATRPEAKGHTYIGGDERYYTLNDLVKAVGTAMDVEVRIVHMPFWPLWMTAVAVELACKPFRLSPPLFRRRVDWFRQVRAFSIDRAMEDLGYRARVGLSEGLTITAEWYKANSYL